MLNWKFKGIPVVRIFLLNFNDGSSYINNNRQASSASPCWYLLSKTIYLFIIFLLEKITKKQSESETYSSKCRGNLVRRRREERFPDEIPLVPAQPRHQFVAVWWWRRRRHLLIFTNIHHLIFETQQWLHYSFLSNLTTKAGGPAVMPQFDSVFVSMLEQWNPRSS